MYHLKFVRQTEREREPLVHTKDVDVVFKPLRGSEGNVDPQSAACVSTLRKVMQPLVRLLSLPIRL